MKEWKHTVVDSLSQIKEKNMETITPKNIYIKLEDLYYTQLKEQIELVENQYRGLKVQLVTMYSGLLAELRRLIEQESIIQSILKRTVGARMWLDTLSKYSRKRKCPEKEDFEALKVFICDMFRLQDVEIKHIKYVGIEGYCVNIMFTPKGSKVNFVVELPDVNKERWKPEIPMQTDIKVFTQLCYDIKPRLYVSDTENHIYDLVSCFPDNSLIDFYNSVNTFLGKE